MLLVGCNDFPTERTEIFALPSGSYGTVFMLAKGYSSDANKVILSLGEKGESHSGAGSNLHFRMNINPKFNGVNI